MDTALIIGGTRFIGRHTVAELLDHGYEVTLFNRGRHENPFGNDDRVRQVTGDRTDRDALEAAATDVDPDVTIDCVAYDPRKVETATEVFADCEAYVYVSSGAVYADDEIPKREGETPLRECSAEQARDDSGASYGPRKAEGDRAVFAAADRGVRAMSVRPSVVYGPHDYTERLDYWIDRVNRYDRIAVPGDGGSLYHLSAVGDVARALRVVAERGTAGDAYNVADRQVATIDERLSLIAESVGTTIEPVYASERELENEDLSSGDFVLYRSRPHLLATNALASLGWEETSLEAATERAVVDHRESDRTGREHGPGRENEEQLIEALDTD
jgi:nucleoside-diphosphate-sugar epimerase